MKFRVRILSVKSIALVVALSLGSVADRAVSQVLSLENASEYTYVDTTDLLLGDVGCNVFASGNLRTIQHNAVAVTKLLGKAGCFVSNGLISDTFTVNSSGRYRLRISGKLSGKIVEGSNTGRFGVSKAGGIMMMQSGLSNTDMVRDTIYETDMSLAAFIENYLGFLTWYFAQIVDPTTGYLNIVNTIADHIEPKLTWRDKPFCQEVETTLEASTEYRWNFLMMSQVACGGIGLVVEAAIYDTHISDLSVELEYLDAPQLEAPTNLRASKGQIFGGYYIEVAWDQVAGADGYIVYKNKVNDPSTAQPIKVVGSIFHDEDVEPNNIYYYWVKARTIPAFSVSELSGEYDWGYVADEVHIVILPPTELSATLGDYSEKIRLAWSNPVSNPDFDAYEVWRNTTNDVFTAVKIADVGDYADPYFDNRADTAADSFAVEIGKDYYYWVKARLNTPDTTYSDFSAGVHGRAGEPFPEHPFQLEVVPRGIVLCGDSIVYSLKPNMYEAHNVCVRAGKTILWRVFGPTDAEGNPLAWLEYKGDSIGTQLPLISTGEDCTENQPLLKYKGSEPEEIEIELGVVGEYYWDTYVSLSLDPLCPEMVEPVEVISSCQYGTSNGNIEFSSDGSVLAIPLGGDRNSYTSLVEMKNMRPFCTFEEGSDARTISPNGEFVLQVQESSGYYHFLIDILGCAQVEMFDLAGSGIVQWSDLEDKVASNTVENNRYNEIRILDPVTGQVVDTCWSLYADDYITDLDWKNNRLAAVGDWRLVEVWSTDGDDYVKLWTYSAQSSCQSNLHSCAFNSDATELAVLWELETDNDCESDNLYVFEVSSGAILRSTRIDHTDIHFTDICWSPDDSMLLLVGRGNFGRVVSSGSFETVANLHIQTDQVGQCWGGAWCDWSSRNVIAIRDALGVGFYTPFDYAGPSISISEDSVSYDLEHPDSTVLYLKVDIDDNCSLQLDSVNIRVNDAPFTTITDEMYRTEVDTANWRFSVCIPNVTKTVNNIWIEATDKAGNKSTKSYLYVNTVTDVEEEPLALPNSYRLDQNYPNPFNNSTIITFSLQKAAHTKLEVFNSLGQLVAVVCDEMLPAGHHSAAWEGSPVSSGVYFYRLTANEFVQTRKMILLK